MCWACHVPTPRARLMGLTGMEVDDEPEISSPRSATPMDQPGDDKNRSPPPQTVDTRPTTPVEPAPTTTTSIAGGADSEPAVASASNSFDSVLNTAPSPDPHLQRLPGIAYVEQQVHADHAQTDPPAERPLNVTDALSYLDAVKNRFQDQPDVYSYFLEIMKDFKGQV
jgi:paired amphipathic helix protein Sin3a